MRYLSGITDTAMTNGAIGPGAQRSSSSQSVAYLDGIRQRLDVDGDSNVDALTDGRLIVRYLFGLRGSAAGRQRGQRRRHAYYRAD